MELGRLIRTHVTTGELAPPQELIEALNNGSTALSEVVKGLGEYLTSTEDETRLKGLTFLSNIVQVIASSRINRPATQTLTSFFLAKLDDFDSLPIALQALTVLSKLNTFNDEAAVDVYQALVEQVNLKSYAQATRHLAYILLDSLLALHRQALKDMGSDFVTSWTKFVDGEKDPRNLMLLFSMDRIILLEFDVANHIEDMFDVTFCYFPIMFKPPPNDPYGITAEDLKLALRGCMSATPLFSKMAIPLFLEKFSTATGVAMKDLLQSMSACFPVYGPTAVQERGSELWEGIKTEIMYSSDSSIEAAALACLESFIRTLYPSALDSPVGLAQEIIKQSLELLKEPEKTQATSATKMLAALLRASPSAGTFAYSQALPFLFRQFNNPSLPSQRAPILSAISSLILAAKTVYASPDTVRRQSEEKSLDPFRESLVDVVREGLRTHDLRSPAIKGAVSIIELPDFVSRTEVEDIVRGMNDILVNDTDLENRATVVKGLTSVSKINSSVVEETTLPLLFHNLPDHSPALHDLTAREKYRSILKSLSELCTQPALFETLVIRITTKLELLSSSPVEQLPAETTDEEYRECEIAFAFDLLHCLSTVIDSKIKEKHVDLVKHFDRIIPRLYTLVIGAASENERALFRDARLLSIVGKISETLMWELSVERQAKHFAAVYAAFEQGAWADIVHDTASVKGLSGSPLRTGASVSERNLIAVYSANIQSIKADTVDPCTSSQQFLSGKIRWTIYESFDDYQLRYALDMITAYVNKRDRELKASLEGILNAIWIKEIIDAEQPFDIRRKALLVYLHIVKALTLLRHPLAYSAVETVVSILKLSAFDPIFVDEAARSFSIIAQGKGKAKQKTSHLTSKLLYAQKMWNHVLPKLIEGDSEAKGRERLPYLVAFSSLLPLVPASLCLSDLNTLLPLLLRSLALRDPQQRTNSMTTLISILETQNMTAEVDTLLHQNAARLVESLSKSYLPDATGEIITNPIARATALRALALIPDAIRFDTLRNSKSIILKDLGQGLDDPVRHVRKEAVECRARWYRYGA